MGVFNQVSAFDDRNCIKCEYWYQEFDGENGEIYCGDFCLKPGQEHFSNLKSFPFKKLMPCFSAGFWHTEFSNGVEKAHNESKDHKKRHERLMSRFRKKYQDGVPVDQKRIQEIHNLRKAAGLEF